mgnify:FL=1
MKHRIRTSTVAVLVLLLAMTAGPTQAQRVEEKPTALAMVGDALIARPLLLGATVVGSVVHTVALPFSAIGGNAGEVGNTLVVGPAKATFVRCLGCTVSGRNTHEVVNPDDD